MRSLCVHRAAVPQAPVEDERVTGVEQHLDRALGLDDRVARLLGAAGEGVALVAARDDLGVAVARLGQVGEGVADLRHEHRTHVHVDVGVLPVAVLVPVPEGRLVLRGVHVDVVVVRVDVPAHRPPDVREGPRPGEQLDEARVAVHPAHDVDRPVGAQLTGGLLLAVDPVDGVLEVGAVVLRQGVRDDDEAVAVVLLADGRVEGLEAGGRGHGGGHMRWCSQLVPTVAGAPTRCGLPVWQLPPPCPPV